MMGRKRRRRGGLMSTKVAGKPSLVRMCIGKEPTLRRVWVMANTISAFNDEKTNTIIMERYLDLVAEHKLPIVDMIAEDGRQKFKHDIKYFDDKWWRRVPTASVYKMQLMTLPLLVVDRFKKAEEDILFERNYGDMAAISNTQNPTTEDTRSFSMKKQLSEVRIKKVQAFNEKIEGEDEDRITDKVLGVLGKLSGQELNMVSANVQRLADKQTKSKPQPDTTEGDW